MTDISLRDRLYRYLLKSHGWVSKGALEKLVIEHTTYTAENTGRRLRELEVDKLIDVEIRKSHAWYRAATKTPQQLSEESIRWFNAI